ncbi:hypothetical protein GCM10027088_15900 [Nocardia goodfellowii]|uniref:Uncharacterized protein n=1 Tax=Nocardia goodfellowii TaxID=882446 RepID=A0ABS4QD55_9NOCA|nr:hypothetical protein [Nocardia goodfellowii]
MSGKAEELSGAPQAAAVLEGLSVAASDGLMKVLFDGPAVAVMGGRARDFSKMGSAAVVSRGPGVAVCGGPALAVCDGPMAAVCDGPAVGGCDGGTADARPGAQAAEVRW